jgi:hypothetical protein
MFNLNKLESSSLRVCLVWSTLSWQRWRVMTLHILSVREMRSLEFDFVLFVLPEEAVMPTYAINLTTMRINSQKQSNPCACRLSSLHNKYSCPNQVLTDSCRCWQCGLFTCRLSCWFRCVTSCIVIPCAKKGWVRLEGDKNHAKHAGLVCFHTFQSFLLLGLFFSILDHFCKCKPSPCFLLSVVRYFHFH